MGIDQFREKIITKFDTASPEIILNLPSYESLTDLIAQANLPMLPAELHGLATGLLVVDTTVSKNRFLQLVLEQPESGNALAIENTQPLIKLFQSVREALQTSTLEFEPLVPDDDKPLAERVDAACEWARGMLYGLTEQGIDQQKDLSEDVSGFVNDLLVISRGGYVANEGEDGEIIYSDLLEYLRMGSLMTQEECQPIKTAQTVLH